ncbi:MAG TPA: HEAT repeat domain-containing protein [Planctomycetota bacterium]|nr:HEAT repeat domain-containing protein [Planctomycetota bacterium]
MARKKVAVEAPPPEAPGRKTSALGLATFLLAGYAAVVGTILLVRGSGPGASPAGKVEGLDERLNRDAADVRASVQKDLTKSLQGFQETVEGAVRRIEKERDRLQAVADEASRRANDASRGSVSRADVLDARVDELAAAATTLRGTLDGLALQVKDLASRPAAVAPVPLAAAPKPVGPAPPPTPAPDAAPTPSGPSEAEVAANKDAVKAAVADLASPDVAKVFAAAANLARLRDLAAVEPLVKVLKEHRDYYARMAAVNALGTMHAADGVLAVIGAFQDKDDAVVIAAALAFSKITGQDTGLTGSPTRKEKGEAQATWTRWWKEHEAEVRTRLNQPAGGAAPDGGGK